MTTKNTPVLRTKKIDQVPFKSELLSKDVSYELLFAAGNKKTYKQFVRDCDNPTLLREVLMLKLTDKAPLKIKKVAKIVRIANTAAAITVLFKGKEMAGKIKCLVYRYYLPKKQYNDAL